MSNFQVTHEISLNILVFLFTILNLLSEKWKYIKCAFYITMVNVENILVTYKSFLNVSN